MDNILQRRVLQTLHYALNPGGYLFLGSSESIGASADLFTIANKEYRIYKKKDVARISRYHPTPNTSSLSPPTIPIEGSLRIEQKPIDLQKLAEKIILKQYSPPAVLVNKHLDIMQFIGNTGPYIEPASGIASLNLIKLIHQDLTSDVRIAIHNAIQNNSVTRRDKIRIHHAKKIEDLSIEVLPLQVHDVAEHYYLIMFHKLAEYDIDEFTEMTARIAKQTTSDQEINQIKELEEKLESTKTYMQSIIEDQEASNEELQAANEEIQSTNEELQSTNEELETAKEELQSTNEELITVNEELENRNNQLSITNDDLKNIISSTDLPLVLLNEELKIRFFSPQAHQLLNLINSDIGRSIGDIRAKIETGDIVKHVEQVNETLQPLILEVHDDKSRWYLMRIQPYRTDDNHIKGAVIVFIDITDSKLLEQTSRLAAVVEDSNDAITVLDFNGRIMAWNPKALEIYGFSEEEAINASIEIITPEKKFQELKQKINDLIQGNLVLPFETERLNKKEQKLRMLVTMSLINDEQGNPTAIATTERLLEN
jgi:two-component system CheB/CheR fusion protein